MINIIRAMAVDLVAGMASQLVALRTAIHLFSRIERKISNGKESGLSVGSLPATEGAVLETLLIGEARIALAELDVGDVSVNLFIPTHCQTVERMIVAVGGELFSMKIGVIFSDGDDVFFAPSTIGVRLS